MIQNVSFGCLSFCVLLLKKLWYELALMTSLSCSECSVYKAIHYGHLPGHVTFPYFITMLCYSQCSCIFILLSHLSLIEQGSQITYFKLICFTERPLGRAQHIHDYSHMEICIILFNYKKLAYAIFYKWIEKRKWINYKVKYN